MSPVISSFWYVLCTEILLRSLLAVSPFVPANRLNVHIAHSFPFASFASRLADVPCVQTCVYFVFLFFKEKLVIFRNITIASTTNTNTISSSTIVLMGNGGLGSFSLHNLLHFSVWFVLKLKYDYYLCHVICRSFFFVCAWECTELVCLCILAVFN